MTTAREIMQTQLITVTEQTPLSEVIALLMAHHVSGLPVVDGDARLVGIITEKDLLHVCHEEPGAFRVAGDLMSRELRAFQVDAPLADLCDCLMTHHFRRVPILEGDKLVGLVSRADLLPTILEIVNERVSEDPF